MRKINKEKQSALGFAVQGGELETLAKLLVDPEVNVNGAVYCAQGTAIYSAIRNKQPDALKMLMTCERFEIKSTKHIYSGMHFTNTELTETYPVEIAKIIHAYKDYKFNSDKQAKLNFAVQAEDLKALDQLLKDPEVAVNGPHTIHTDGFYKSETVITLALKRKCKKALITLLLSGRVDLKVRLHGIEDPYLFTDETSKIWDVYINMESLKESLSSEEFQLILQSRLEKAVPECFPLQSIATASSASSSTAAMFSTSRSSTTTSGVVQPPESKVAPVKPPSSGSTCVIM